MEVTLSKHAWHVNFYRWATGDNPKWNNLCPYFWSLIFILLISPLILMWKIIKFILVKPIKKLLVHKTPNKKKVSKERKPFMSPKGMKNSLKIREFIGEVFVISYFILVFLIVAVGIYKLFTTAGVLVGIKILLSIIGFMVIVIAITLGILLYFTSDTHKMVKGIIKSKKDKICPFINWKE